MHLAGQLPSNNHNPNLAHEGIIGDYQLRDNKTVMNAFLQYRVLKATCLCLFI